MAGSLLWPRDGWLDAMWDDEALKPNERLVGHVYARFAGSSDLTWCSWSELQRRTGIRSRDAINRAIKGLISSGWLEEIAPARQHYSARYRLVQPSVSQTPEPDPGGDSLVDSAVDNPAQQSGKQTAEPPTKINTDEPSSPFNETSSPSPETSSPFNGPHLSNGLLKRTTQRSGHAAPRPLRTETTQAPSRTDHDPPPTKADPDQIELAGNQKTARANARRLAELDAVAAMDTPDRRIRESRINNRKDTA